MKIIGKLFSLWLLALTIQLQAAASGNEFTLFTPETISVPCTLFQHANGKKVSRFPLCFSKASLRKEWTECFRKEAAARKNQILFATAPAIDRELCHCVRCQALAKKYALPAGAILDHMIQLCNELKKSVPDIKIAMILRGLSAAHLQSKSIPDNLLLLPDFRDADFSKGLDHKNNLAALQTLRRWKAAAPDRTFLPLYTGIGGETAVDFEQLANFIQTASRNGVTQGIVLNPQEALLGFGTVPIREHLLMQHAQNPKKNWKETVSKFIESRYGKVAVFMKSYIFELQESRSNSANKLSVRSNIAELYPPFTLVRLQMLFDRMEQMAGKDSALLQKIRFVRVDLDLITLQRYGFLRRFRLPYTAETLRDRCLKTLQEVQKKPLSDPAQKKARQKACDSFLKKLQQACAQNHISFK